MAKVKDLLVNGSSRFIGKIYASDQFISQVANGTAPFVVSSSTLVVNLNADMTDGLHVHTGRNNEVNKIVRTDGYGYIQTGYINTDVGTQNFAISRIFYEYNNDGYIRKMSPSSFFSALENSGNDISITVAGQNRKLTVGYASNADKLGGVHYQNILERINTGYSESGTATGWFRIAETLTTDGAGITFLLAIQRNYNYTNNESYLFSISISYNGGISITQLSGYANSRLITKIRVDWSNSQIAYIDLYINASYTNNGYYWYTVGCAKSYTAWTANPTLIGTAYEFTTVNGCKSDRGFTGDLTGTASKATDADTLDGYHATYGINKPWGTIPVITNGGYMDVGKHFEFHYDNTTGSDYSTVLGCTGNYSNIVSLPSKSGTLALLTDNVASASKWATPRTITLTGSVTGSVSIDGSQNVSLATTTNHTHDYAGSSSAGGSANSALTLLYNNKFDTTYGDYAIFQQFAGLSDLPHTGWFNSIKMLHNNSAGYFTEIVTSFTGEDGMWRRALRGGAQVGWYKMLDSGNYNSYSPKLDGTGATGTWGINISGSAATATKARYLQADNDAASPGGALLRSGSGRADTSPSGDTWIFWDELGGTSYYWGIRHNQANNSIGFCGAGSETSNINLETGKITSKGFILTGSSSSYVLLGNGGHKLESSLSVNYANSAGNADTVGNKHVTDFYKSGRAYPCGKYDKPWHKVASFTQSISGTQINTGITFYVGEFYLSRTYGILNIQIRNEADHVNPEFCYVVWSLNNGIDPNEFVVGHSYSGNTVTYNLYAWRNGWSSYNIRKIAEQAWGMDQDVWTCYDAANGNSNCFASIPESNKYTSSNLTISNPTNWDSIIGKPSTYTPASHTHPYLPLSGGTLTGELISQNGGIWVQGGSSAGGNVGRMGLVGGMPTGLAYNTSKRGVRIYSNAIAFADPYNGNSNNDSGWIRHLETATNNGVLEIAVGDDADSEEIHFRYYNTSSNIPYDILVPRATGTLALTSQLPTISNSNGYVPKLISFPSYYYFGSSTDTHDYLKNIVKWIYDNANYGGGTYLMGVGHPNSLGMMNIQLYGNSGKNSEGWPRYCSGTFLNLGSSSFDIFGTVDYSYYHYSLSVDGHSHRITKLYRRDDSSDYSIQHYWTGTYWYLRGYSGDAFHAEVQVGYANSAGSAGYTTRLYANSTEDLITYPGDYSLAYSRFQAGASNIFPVSNNANGVITAHLHAGNYFAQIGLSSNGRMYYRTMISAALNAGVGWNTVAWTSDIPTSLPANGGNADTVDGQHFSYSNDSNSPTYLWATNSNGSSFLAARGSISVNYANSAGSAGTANGLASTGYGNSNLTYYQTSNSFFGNSGWCHYIIANHGDGSSYYNFTIGLPFWGVPIYKRLEGGGDDGWHTFITSENVGSQSVNYADSASYASNAGDADKLDGYHLSQITPVVTKRDFTNGTLVKTNISFPGTNTFVSEAFLLNVRGNGYGGGIINFEFQGYVYYTSSYTNPQIIDSDFIIYSPNSIDKIYTMSIDNKLCFWWARQSYWQGFHIFCTTNTESYQNRVTEVQDVSKPSGLFEQSYTPKLSLTTSNYTSYTVTKTGGGASGTWDISITGNAATATDADKLDGYHKNDILRKTVGPTSVISLNNVVADGTDFTSWDYAHSVNVNNQPWGDGASSAASVVSFGTDYPFQIYSDYSNTSYLYYRSYYAGNGWKAWRQFAFIDSNVASASKWATPRTITLTGSVTGSVSIDGSQNVSLATTTNHTHDYAGSSSAGGSANSALTLLYNNKFDTTYGDYAIFQQFAGLSDLPHTGWFNSIKMLHNNSAGYFTEIVTSFTGEDGMWRRALRGGAQVGWYKMLDSGNYNSYVPTLTGTGATGTWGINISGNAATATNAENISSIYPQLAASLEADEINVKRKIDWNNWGDYGYQLEAAIDFNWYETHNLFGVIRGSSSDSAGFGWMYSSDGSTYTPIARLSPSGQLYLASSLTISGAISGVTDITASGHAKVNSLKTQYICIECDNSGNSSNRGSEINNYSSTLYLQYDTSNSCCICYGGGGVGIGTVSPSSKLHVVGDIYTTTGFKKEGSSDSYVLLGGGGHKALSDFDIPASTTSSGITSLATGSYSSIHISTRSGGTMSFSSTPAYGKECHIIIYNSGSSTITITLPSGYRRNIDSITIASGAFGEVNVLNAAGTIYVRAV